MAGPVAKRWWNLWKLVRSRPELRGVRGTQVAVAAIAAVALLLGWLVGQAWVTARDGDTPTQAVARPDLAPPSNLSTSGAATATATLTLSPDTTFQSGDVVISGVGFGPLETVIISAKDGSSGEPRELLRATADWRGAFPDQSLSLPEWLTSGKQPIEAIGERSGNRGLVTLNVRAKERWVNLSSYGVKQAETMGFVAGGFEPGEDVNIYLAEGQDLQPDESATPIATVKTDSAGNTDWTQWEVPLVKAGTYSLMFRGAGGEPALSRNIVINALVPSVELSPWSGPPGIHVELNGQGFVPGEQVGVYLGDSTEAALIVMSDEYGNFWSAGPLVLPYDARGSYRVTFVGELSHALVSRSFGIVAPKPWVELSTYAGFAGTSVFFSGGGFAAREQISIHVGSSSAPTISVGAANEQGYYQFIGPVNVPPDATEEVTFVLFGESSRASGRATFKVLTPWLPGPTDG